MLLTVEIRDRRLSMFARHGMVVGSIVSPASAKALPYSALQSGWIMGPMREFWVPHFGHIVGVLLEATCQRFSTESEAEWSKTEAQEDTR